MVGSIRHAARTEDLIHIEFRWGNPKTRQYIGDLHKYGRIYSSVP